MRDKGQMRQLFIAHTVRIGKIPNIDDVSLEQPVKRLPWIAVGEARA